jgi:hypothetical protein
MLRVPLVSADFFRELVGQRARVRSFWSFCIFLKNIHILGMEWTSLNPLSDEHDVRNNHGYSIWLVGIFR